MTTMVDEELWQPETAISASSPDSRSPVKRHGVLRLLKDDGVRRMVSVSLSGNVTQREVGVFQSTATPEFGSVILPLMVLAYHRRYPCL